MEFLMKRHTVTLAFAALILCAAGCGKPFRLERVEMHRPAPWPYHHGDSAGTGFVASAGYDGSLDLLWEYRTIDKIAGPLAVSKGRVVYPTVNKKIRFVEVDSGYYEGRLRSQGIPQSGMMVTDSLGFYVDAPQNDMLNCVNLLNGGLEWEVPIRSGTPVTPLDKQRVLVAAGTGLLQAIAIADGSSLWQYRSKERFDVPPTVAGELVFQPTDAGTLLAIRSSDGTLVYSHTVTAPIVSPAAIGPLVYVGDMSGTITALEPHTGEVVWTYSMAHPIWTTPAIAQTAVVGADNSGTVAALDPRTGTSLWTVSCNQVICASPIIVGGIVVVGTQRGFLYTFDLTTGRKLGGVELRGPIEFPPVSDGQRIYVASQRGELLCFGRSAIRQDTTAAISSAGN